MADNNFRLGAVGRFFFTPTDSSTLGLIRVLAGFVMLYTHASYCFDLTSFFGPNAWWDHEVANRQRREAPTFVLPIGWADRLPSVRIEDVPHRRAAQAEFFRTLPEEPAARAEKLRYLINLLKRSSPDNPSQPDPLRDGIYLVNSALRLVDDANELVRLDRTFDTTPFDTKDSPISYFPQFFAEASPAERRQLWAGVKDLIALLPRDSEQIEYVLDWLSRYAGKDNTLERGRLVLFLTGELKTPEGKDVSLPSSMKAREEWLEFVRWWGGDPRQTLAKGTSIFSVWFHLTDPTTIWIVHLCSLAVIFLFAIGLWTRVTSVITWAISLSYIHRSQVTLFGQDTMQTLLITYLMIGSSGASFSVDSLRARYRAARAMFGSKSAVPWAQHVLSGPASTTLANFAIRMFQINFCFIYMSSGVSKLKGQTWWNHSAGWLTMSNTEFGLIRYQWYQDLLTNLGENRLFMAVLAGGISLFTLALEISLPYFVWTRLRPLAVSCSAMLHAGIAIMMGLTVFAMYMFSMLLAYFPAKLIRERFGIGPDAGTDFTVQYDPTNASALRKAAWLKALDLGNRGKFVPTDGAGAIVKLTDGDGVTWEGQKAFSNAFKVLPILRSLAWVRLIPISYPIAKLVVR